MSKYFHDILAILYGVACFYLALNGKTAELAGFVVAGAIMLAFLKLESLKEFSGAGFSVKMKERLENLETDIAPIKLRETEPDKDFDKSADEFFLDEATDNVLFHLTNGKYSWRTMSGLLTDCKLKEKEILKILEKLKEDRLVVSSSSSSGKTIWAATDKGHEVAQLHFPGSNRTNA